MYANDNNGFFPYEFNSSPQVVANGLSGPENRQLWQPYVTEASVFYCPGSMGGLMPLSAEDTSAESDSTSYVGWNVFPILPPTDTNYSNVATSYSLFASYNNYTTSMLNRVHLLLSMNASISEISDHGNSEMALPGRLDASDSAELPFAADWMISRNLGAGTGCSSLVKLATEPFYAYRVETNGDTTEVNSHFNNGFEGLNVAFYDGHVEWRAKGTAGPRINVNITSNYPPSDYGWVFWF